MAKIILDASRGPSEIQWSLTMLASLGLTAADLEEKFRAGDVTREDVVWTVLP